MANLLERIRQGGSDLLSGLYAAGTHKFSPPSMPQAEELAGEDLAAAKEMYDRQFRAARHAAIMSGQANWTNMNDFGHMGAQAGYVDNLEKARQSAENLRKSREDAQRRADLAAHVTRLAGLDPEDPDYLSPADAGFLSAAGPETQERVLSSYQFPGISGATEGVFKYERGKDGYIYGMNKDKTWFRTDVQWDPSTAESRTFDALGQDPEYMRFKEQIKFRERYGAEAAQVQSEAESKLPGVIQSTNSTIDRLENLKARVAQIPSGRLEGKIREQFNAELQAINADLSEMALMNIAALAEKGVRLNPITEAELKLLMSTSAELRNEPGANVAIIERRIAAMQSIVDQAYDLLNWIDTGKPVLQYRPASYYERRDAGGASGGNGAPAPPPGTVVLPPE